MKESKKTHAPDTPESTNPHQSEISNSPHISSSEEIAKNERRFGYPEVSQHDAYLPLLDYPYAYTIIHQLRSPQTNLSLLSDDSPFSESQKEPLANFRQHRGSPNLQICYRPRANQF